MKKQTEYSDFFDPKRQVNLMPQQYKKPLKLSGISHSKLLIREISFFINLDQC